MRRSPLIPPQWVQMVTSGWQAVCILQGVQMKPFALAHSKCPAITNNKSVIYKLQSDSVAPNVHL